MSLAAAAFSALVLTHGAAAIVPPADPGPWRQLGAKVTSRPGKLAHSFRNAGEPTALGVVAVTSSRKPIRLTWFAHCEFESDDEMTSEHQGTASGVHRVVVHPPVLTGATLCTVAVTVRVSRGRASGAVFDY